MVGSVSCTFSGKDDLDLDKMNNVEQIVRPTTSTSGYLSNVSQLHLSSGSSRTCSPSALSTTWRSIDEDDYTDKSFGAKVNNQLPTNSPQSYKITANSLRHLNDNPDLVISTKDESPEPLKDVNKSNLITGNDDDLPMDEATKRTIKAESFRKMLSDAAYTSYTPIHRRGQSINSSFRSTIGGLPSSSTASTLVGDLNSSDNQPLRKICSSGDIQNIDTQNSKVQDVKTIFSQEKRRRAELLALSSEIAKEATERSRKVASITHGTHSPSSFI